MARVSLSNNIPNRLAFSLLFIKKYPRVSIFLKKKRISPISDIIPSITSTKYPIKSIHFQSKTLFTKLITLAINNTFIIKDNILFNTNVFNVSFLQRITVS